MQNEVNKYAHAFLKFGKKEHMENLLYHGEIFLNTMQYYHASDNREIGDVNEGLIQELLPNIVDINNMACIGTNVRLRYSDMINKNLFCLFCLKDNDFIDGDNKYTIDLSQFKEFGGYCVLFHNLPPFVKKLTDAIDRLGLKLEERKLVRYEDFNTYKGKINPFVKDKKYEHQNEYRFLVSNKVNDAIKLDLGNLEEFAKIFPVDNYKIIFSFEK